MNNKKIEKQELLKKICSFVETTKDSTVDIKYFKDEREFTNYIFNEYSNMIQGCNYDFSISTQYSYELSNILDIIEDSNIPVNSDFIMRNDTENGYLYLMDAQADLNEIVDFVSGDKNITNSKYCYYNHY